MRLMDRALEKGIAEVVCATNAVGPRFVAGETLLLARDRTIQTKYAVTITQDGRQWIGRSEEEPPIIGTKYPIVGMMH
ncbi:hypothetical protein [Thalassospira lohafexi]|uniref:Uncharacterized protein n=1 Tax=Thalassospira lohafexi TaxID=744227 RepID=A0A2N3L0T9_9PROT|nr:hypothetical protein [Thalassospira lohafexi]PKR56336.1 hypothetical protein COO92_21260 [Thalassospira lohafexi]